MRPLVLAFLAVSIAALAGHDAFMELRYRRETPEHFQHSLETNWRSRFEPAYVAPPFVGRRYVYESPLEMRSIYVFAVATLVGALAIRNAARRQRGL